MSWPFPGHVADTAKTWVLCAGMISDSGRVSTDDYRDAGASCIVGRRVIETIGEGAPPTGFMKFGGRVRMAATLPGGTPLFGGIGQKVVQA